MTDDELLAQTMLTRVKATWRHRRPWTSNKENFEAMNDWCSKNCQGRWRWTGLYWNFDDDQDYVMFILRWSDGR